MKDAKTTEAVRTDYHVHPDYSIDAIPVKIREYCCQAIELRLKEVCFTTHFELDPVRRQVNNFVFFNGRKHPADNLVWLDSYFKEIEDARREFRDIGLEVKAGIEIGYAPGLERGIESVLEAYPFDFVLGAIHCLDHISISSKQESARCFANHSLHEMRERYFHALREAVQTGLFDCIAHVDLYRRYGLEHYGPEILTIHRGVIEPVLEKMARRGMGLEINTSSLRRGIEEFHPSREIVSLAVEAGITVFTVGSDAHRLGELGEHIDEVLALLDEFGLCNHIFTKRQAIPGIENGCGTGRQAAAGR